jgi:hypothetical protein
MPDNSTPIDKFDKELQDFTRDESVSLSHIVGITSGLFGAIVWGILTYYTHFIIGYFSIALGVLVGFSVKKVGKGSGKSYGLLAGTYALLSCLFGMLLSIVFFVGAEYGISLYKIPFLVNYNIVASAYFSEFDFHDLLFYGIAFISAYKIALNPFKKDELDLLLEEKGFKKENAKYGDDYFKNKKRK